MKKSYIIAALALTSCMVVGTAAASQSNSVTATFRPDVTLKVNGTTYTVRATTGVKVSPLIYNGTTYLPLSSLGQLLGAEVSWDNDSQTVIIHDDDAGYIGESKAKELALKHAGLSGKEVSFLQLKLDWDDGRAVYEVEFYSGSREYDYEIDALTGAVVDFDSDIEDYTTPSDSADLIGKDRAKELALKHAGLSGKEVSFVRVELDRDDGRMFYEVEFYSGSREYDYEIDALTGAVVDFDSDIEDYTIPSAPSDSKDYISREKAQKLAQDKAPKATLIQLELDVDDGRAVYEGELREGSMEYEFEIDAITGSFLKWEQERD